MRTKPPRQYSLGSLASLAALAVVSAASAADYQSTVLSDNPKAYYRLNDSTIRSRININSGSLGAAGNATNDAMYFKGGENPTGIVHPFSGAIVGDPNRSEFFDFTTRTEIPWNAAFNTPNTQPFTVEAWFYPASDQTGTGQAPINNRYTSGSNRQGWTFFQRRPDPSYFPGDNGLGWNFRMYNGVGGATPMDIQSGVPYQVGKWQHVVVTYDPVAANNATLIIYIDGVAANTNAYVGTDPGYAPCTGDHPPAEATSGQPNLSIGCYNNANTGLNPYFGGVDEFAWYPSKLTPAQVLAHYQNGTNANRTTPYDVLIKSANPVLYLRLNEIAPNDDVAINLGDLRSSGIATNTAEVRHPAPGALAGRTDSGAVAYHWHNGTSTTDMPWLLENNPDASVPFTIEGWFRPTSDRINPGAAVINNRLSSGAVNRTGWVIFQRAPNNTYSGLGGYEGVGWDLRMYQGSGGASSDVVSSVPYTVGQWQHVVGTWDGAGTLTMYINGDPAATNVSAVYTANSNPPLPPDDALAPVDFAVGSYNKASGLGANPFEGDVAEVALYNNYQLTPEQVLAHYQAGTNAHPATNYETLVFTAGFTGPERVGLPKTFLHFNDPAHYPATNSGTLGAAADGNLVLTTNVAAGPQSPAYLGFEASNTALPLNGVKQWASFNNPAGLNISGQITLEAWVKPDATQPNDPARLISHGPTTYTEYLVGPPPTDYGAPTNGNEVFLKIEGAGPFNYTVGSATFTLGLGTTYSIATAAAPAGDFGSGNWVHLVGTYDGANWRLYRNGVQIANTPSSPGALPVINGDWAIGSTGEGWAGNLAGTIDEPAIYNYALSASRVAAHYSMGRLGANPLTITRSGANVILTWPAGTLQQATVVSGPYTDMVATSPFSTPATGTQHYYRIRL
jgi:hypothetical protein